MSTRDGGENQGKTQVLLGSGKPDPTDLVTELSHRLRQTARDVVPRFVEQMPGAYFHDTDRPTQLTHLSAIIAARSSGSPLRMTLRSEDGAVWTFLHEGSFPGVLARLLKQLPASRPLGSAKVHTAADDALVLDVFRFREAVDHFDASDPVQADRRAAALRVAEAMGDDPAADALSRHCEACSAEYMRSVNPKRIYTNWRLVVAALGSDDTLVELGDPSPSGLRRFTVATSNVDERSLLERIVAHIGRYGLNIHRAYLDRFDHGSDGVVTLLGVVVQEHGFLRDAPMHDEWHQLRRDLIRLKWVDSQVLELLDARPQIGLLRAEVIVALCHLVHAILGREDSHGFSRARLADLARHHLDLTVDVADLLLQRFDPDAPLQDADFGERSRMLRDRIDIVAEGDAHAQRFFEYLLAAVERSLRTNAFVDQRYGLALRLDPRLLARPDRPELPYGVFFVHGRGFDGFHVRFRDIARGGVRLVRAFGPGEHGRESVRLYDEAYELAYAQQLKNKDIPEGGSKAVMLAEPGVEIEPSVKAFIDCLLDLLSPDPTLRSNIVDLWGREEMLYLGPDENISSELIEWIVERARKRGHSMPGAFMSSKPGAGINHKEYGVTSEGVTVFLEEALRAVGIDPREQPFSVKLTGGPDGDVAGNEIRILQREFGDHARIVGIADGSGIAEDPDGLDHFELLRLVAASAPIVAFDRTKLGPKGRVVALEEPDGRRLRNTLHNRLVTDAFVPAGGRPATINETNWSDFLAAGRPASRVIVEGANLFITAEARRHLSDVGVLIVKDSSANKCGVICSSLEIVASMLLTPEEMLEVKDRFVEEVLHRLRDLARREARLLFREFRLNPSVPLPLLSTEVSGAILRATDAIEAILGTLAGDDRALMYTIVEDHLPPVVVERAKDRIVDRIPPTYLNGIIASSLAARIVYREGMAYLASIPDEELARVAVRYLRQERETGELIAELAASNLPSRQRIIALLRQGGARAGVTIDHGVTMDDAGT